MSKTSGITIQNKKALFDYEILQTYEAGVELLGCEVKSIRASRANLKDSFIKIVRSEAFLFNMHISFLDTTYLYYKPNERRERRLLLHRKEIDKLFGLVSQKGLAIVPLKVYFNSRNFIKVQIALARGKKLYDKRESLKKKILNREIQTQMKHRFD